MALDRVEVGAAMECRLKPVSEWRCRCRVVEVPAADLQHFLPLVALSGGGVDVGVEDRINVPREVERKFTVQHELPPEAGDVGDLFRRLRGRRGWCLRRGPRRPPPRRIAGRSCRDSRRWPA